MITHTGLLKTTQRMLVFTRAITLRIVAMTTSTSMAAVSKSNNIIFTLKSIKLLT